MDLIRKCGYYPTGFVAGMGMEAKLDGLKDTMGRPIFDNYKQSENQYTLKGKPLHTGYPLGNMDAAAASATMIAGAWNKAVYCIRQDLTDIATEASLFDNSGTLQYNLFQQDMIALRCVLRLGWQIPNPVNRIQSTASEYPFSVLVPAA